MKQAMFMRVLFCKIHCPLMCFCKPSAAHLYTTRPLKLENTPHVVPSAVYVVPDVSHKSTSGVKEDGVNGKDEAGIVPKSCMKKLPSCSESTNEVGKKRVQWMDGLGKELAEIKEFESSETGDTDNEEENSHCLCVIL